VHEDLEAMKKELDHWKGVRRVKLTELAEAEAATEAHWAGLWVVVVMAEGSRARRDATGNRRHSCSCNGNWR